MKINIEEQNKEKDSLKVNEKSISIEKEKEEIKNPIQEKVIKQSKENRNNIIKIEKG